MKNIIWLNNLRSKDLGLAGGKGAQLGELINAGFSVPKGFVITTKVYKEIISISGLGRSIQQILSKSNIQNTDELQKAGIKIRDLLVSVQLPYEVEQDIKVAYNKIKGLVAVRSSATAEDLKDASFAGQQETFLNITEDKLIESVKKCIASLFTARSLYYRNQKNISHDNMFMAVVVQKMVDAKKAGVAFTVNPVTNNEKELIIEAVTGLGEAIVSGETTPDNYTIDKETESLTHSTIQAKKILTNSEIMRISKIAREIENHYLFPVDVEWAIDVDDGLHILQARAITTLSNKQKTWKRILAREYGIQYAEISLNALTPKSRFIVPKPFYEQVYIPEDKNEVCYIDENMWNIFVTSLKEQYLDNPQNYDSFENLFMKTGKAYMNAGLEICATNLTEKSNAELKKLYQNYQDKALQYAPFIWIQFIINNFFAENAKQIINKKLGNSKDINDYYEVALSPQKKASCVKLSELTSRWKILDDKTKKQTYETLKWLPCLDIHHKHWSKEQFFSHMNSSKKAKNRKVMSYSSMIERINPSSNERKILNIARRLAYLKDLKDDFRRQGIFYAQPLFQQISERMGIKLTGISYMLESEIIKFLETGKMVSKHIINERKKGFVMYFSKQHDIECKSGKQIENALKYLGIVIFEDFSEEIKGVTASPGIAKGTVTIVRGVADLQKVKDGTIIVATTTHPDYVPAMQKAAAIVTDEGGITSHAAIVSRELKLPCVVGAKGATKSLKDGDKVEVDATKGLVMKIKSH